MVRFKSLVALVAVISLSLSVIWPNSASAATVPLFASLGQLEEALHVPGKMDIDAKGNLYVADARDNRVLKFDASGALLATFAEVPVSGTALAVTADGTRVYTVAAGSVVVLDGQTGASLGGLGVLTNVGDIAVDAFDRVYVVDKDNRQIIKYDANGTLLKEISGLGESDGLFRKIDSLAVNDATNELYVSGSGVNNGTAGRSIVQIFDLEGVFQSKLVATSDFSGSLMSCSGIAFGPDGLEFYLDELKANIRVRDHQTGYLTTLDIGGSGAGLMAKPVDLVYDATSNRLLVASDNKEIEIFGVNGGTTPAANEAPSVPVPVSPIAGGNALSVSPQLRFLAASDVNGDAIDYDVELINEATYTTVQTDGVEAYATVGTVLNENSAYSWKVRARDTQGAVSDWSAVQSFFVNADNSAPSAPELLTGAKGEVLAGSGLLSWSVSTDPDPNDAVTYRLEIAEDATFTEPTALVLMPNNEVRLDALVDYSALQDGVVYIWRVSAVDSQDLATASEIGNFRYDTAMLTVSANLPDAEVFLGGNAAYAGNRVGVTPVEFRDMAPGAYTVVVERAGCEQSISQIVIEDQGNANIVAALDLAVVSSFKSGSVLRAGKSKLNVVGAAAPFAVDFNNDGITDLLIGDDSGALTLFTAHSQRGTKVQYATGVTLDAAVVGDAVPFVVDWNNDNRKDLLVGAVDGTVSLFLQKSSSDDLSPVFEAGELLMTDALVPLNAGSAVSPAVVDFDDDGDKDLVVGTTAGVLSLYLNIGTDAAPVLKADAVALGSFSGPVAPLFIDWDADGQRDLLLGSNGELKLAQGETGDMTYPTVFTSRVTLADEKVRFFVIDADGEGGKDVFAGLNDGSVSFFRSGGRDYQASVKAALLDKTAQLTEMTSDVLLVEMISAVALSIDADNLKAAGAQAKTLAVVVAGSELETAASELLELVSR